MSNDNSVIPVTLSSPVSGEFPHRRSNGLALVEGIILLVGLAVLDQSGLLPFEMWPVQPFLFVVILLSAQYGIQGGILAALGAIALSHIGGWPTRPIDMTYAEYFRLVWADSLSWVIAALTVGVVTSHRSRTIDNLTAKLRKATVAESLIAAQYQVLAQRTHNLEHTLAARPDMPSGTNLALVPSRPGTRSASGPKASGRSRRKNINDVL